MSAVQSGNNGVLVGELSAQEQELLRAFRGGDFNTVTKVVGNRINAAEAEAEQLQKEHALDLIACELVKAIDDCLDDLAYKLATARGNKSRWSQERAADDLLRELAQFLTRSEIDKSDEGEFPISHRHHLSDPIFRYEWFGVSPLVDGTLVSTKE